MAGPDALLSAAPFAAAAVDGEVDPRFVLVNEAFARAFDLGAPERLIGTAATLALEPALDAATRKALGEALDAARAARAPRSIEAACGGRWWSLTVTPVEGDARMLLTARDTQGDRIVDLFASVVGHDVRNALSVISMGIALVLRGGGLSEHQEQHVRRMQGAGERIARMVGQVLDVLQSHGDGGLALVREPTSLRDIVERVVGEARVRHPDRSLRIQAADPATGEWDAARVEQIVREVVGNALAHGDPAAPVEVTVRDGVRDVELAVMSRGAPLPDGARNTVLDPLRSPRTRLRQKGGLGVYVAGQLARAHGGSLDLAVGAGSVSVVVRLPR